jgi:protein-disulfide isomerase
MIARLKTALDWACTLLVAVSAVAVLWRVYAQKPFAPSNAPLIAAETQSSIHDVTGLSIAAGEIRNVRGSGQVVLVEFSDYECPFCAQHALKTEPQLVKQFVESGKMRHIVFNYPLPFHPQAQKASEAAECAARQGRFWEMHDQLFSDQAGLDLEGLLSRGAAVAPDKAAFEVCLRDGSTVGKVLSDLAEGRRIGVDATPTFFLGRIRDDGSIDVTERLNGAPPFDEFDRAIKRLLE